MTLCILFILRLTYRISGDLLECMYVTQFFPLINFTLRTQVVFGCLSVAMEIEHSNFCAKPSFDKFCLQASDILFPFWSIVYRVRYVGMLAKLIDVCSIPSRHIFFLIGIFLSIDVSILGVRTVPLVLTNFYLEKIQKRRCPCPRGRATVHLIH